jgi:alanyl-tRNA synthetase
MDSTSIRNTFLKFFEDKEHQIVKSAPMVNKDDPTLMFTNAGMNQFKDYFLGHKEPTSKRIADTQKCLRVSGKHNDLEEVGRDSYHHTMFEMLGNWSFGDYFKKEAIAWGWELLTEVYGLPKDRLYVTIFEGDAHDGLQADEEAAEYWADWIDKDRILEFSKKDNFWEMGEIGPCGPCSEIHIDLRTEKDREELDGRTLVNMDHPEVVEIWNLVFIQFNRNEQGILKELPAKHVDTGMGFERLCMALQGKRTNYDTDIFRPIIKKIETDTDIAYKGSYAQDAYVDIAMRVIADHLRAVSFAIADGALPSNTGAGYVIRRILRRAIRYYYSYLNLTDPYIYKLVPMISDYFKEIFPELKAQQDFVATIIREEEHTFLRTLQKGLDRLGQLKVENNQLNGRIAFELYDTYGFPIDLSRLIAEEKGWTIDEEGFKEALQEQKSRSRQDAQRAIGDWIELREFEHPLFLGYESDTLDDVRIVKYRTVKHKNTEYHLVLDRTPFYAESGGQIGDTGTLSGDGESIVVLDTFKENDLIVHKVDKFPAELKQHFIAQIDIERRRMIENNHSATHLLHAALRQVLGAHVQQKGSLVSESYLRFDFSHFNKMTEEEIREVEQIVNKKVRENIILGEARDIPLAEAKERGAMMLFGEKYGETVRMISFDPSYSVELCGGCHVPATGRIGVFKIISESAIAAGIRRIEAVTADGAEQFINDKLDELEAIGRLIPQQNIVKGIQILTSENKSLKKELELLQQKMSGGQKDDLLKAIETKGDFKCLFTTVSQVDAKSLKNLLFQIEKEHSPMVVALGAEVKGKPQIMMAISRELTESHDWHAGNLIRAAAAHIKGGGGGQAFFASAGGSDASGLEKAIEFLKKSIMES